MNNDEIIKKYQLSTKESEYFQKGLVRNMLNSAREDERKLLKDFYQNKDYEAIAQERQRFKEIIKWQIRELDGTDKLLNQIMIGMLEELLQKLDDEK